jgi:AcrR family transcriptional regulator
MAGIVAAAGAVRRPGRPRDVGADTAILDAALELAGTVGIAAMSVDAIAARAGVSKATIYRRWASKEAMVLDAWRVCVAEPAAPDTGTLRGDLEAYYTAMLAKFSSGHVAKVLPQMVAAAKVNEEFGAAYREYVYERRAPMRATLQRAVKRGELPGQIDLELVHDLIVGPLFYRLLLSGVAVSPKNVRSILDIVLAGLAAVSDRHVGT